MTGLRLILSNFDPNNKLFSANDAIHLLDKDEKEVMTWTFAKLIGHWKAKHGQVAFVPSQARKIPQKEYRFGNQILLGEGTEFQLFLKAVSEGIVYYDPGIHLEHIFSPKPVSKRRSQFRIKSKDLHHIYHSIRSIDFYQPHP
jgi:hypothetical protein